MGKKEHPGKRHVGRWILATLALRWQATFILM